MSLTGCPVAFSPGGARYRGPGGIRVVLVYEKWSGGFGDGSGGGVREIELSEILKNP